ncbi:ketopantoate reductase family protein [Pannonibacter phragmitetus]|uniref:ketopantoate reductase family protein n=1 Tax=Pannonibacter phragmitetus TaxID=121719 RepID=UPI003D2EFEC5
MTWAILGAGALGSVIGAELFNNGADIVLLDTNEAHLKAIQSEGLRVDWDDRTDHLPIRAMRPENAPELELVILLTKTMHSQAALSSIAPRIAAGACVLTLQNGLGNVERICGLVPETQILYGCTMTPGDLRGPGHVVSHGIAYTPSRRSLKTQLQDVFQKNSLLPALRRQAMRPQRYGRKLRSTAQ